MTIKFNVELLIKDLELVRKRRKISMQRAAYRMGVHTTTIYNLKSGKIKDITVHTLARIVDFIDNPDISKYIYDDGEEQK